jgi:hypothetical protein
MSGHHSRDQTIGSEQDFFAKFSQAWRSGYFEGNPLDLLAAPSYGPYGCNSILYTFF